MNQRQLEVFEAVMRTGSVSEAARLLHVSQPAVTKSVRLAEQAVGFVLFRRARGRLFPSPEAEALMPQVARVRAELDATTLLSRQLRDGSTGTVAVATVGGVGHAFVTPAVARFTRERPGIRVEVMLVPTVIAAERVAQREADFGLVHEPTDNPHVDGEVIGQTEALAFVPRRHPLARRKSVGARDLAGEVVISYREDTAIGGLVRKALAATGRRDVNVVINQSLQAIELVEAGVGVAVIDPFLHLGRPRPGLVGVPFRPSIPCRLRVIRARERPRSRTAAQLERVIRDLVARHLATGPSASA